MEELITNDIKTEIKKYEDSPEALTNNPAFMLQQVQECENRFQEAEKKLKESGEKLKEAGKKLKESLQKMQECENKFQETKDMETLERGILPMEK